VLGVCPERRAIGAEGFEEIVIDDADRVQRSIKSESRMTLREDQPVSIFVLRRCKLQDAAIKRREDVDDR